MGPDLKVRSAVNNPLKNTIQLLSQDFQSIGMERKDQLLELTRFIVSRLKRLQKVELVFICTHNSRRSQICQIWAQAAAYYYGIENLITYSGGTEATAFNPRAVRAMKEVGFKINALSHDDNPVHEVQFSEEANEIIAFSKKYDSEANPKTGFAAIMTCSDADENCPVIFGMDKKISLPYDDPKQFDGSRFEASRYSECVNLIGKEMLFIFSQVSI